MKYFLVVTFEMVMKLLFALPRYRLVNYFKSLFLRILGAKIGKRLVLYPGVWIAPGRNLVIGDDVDLALDVLITTSGGVEIGDRTLVGYRTQIISGNHQIPINQERIFDSGHDFGKVVIQSDCWIGANCLIMPGVTVGEGAVVAGGSVVTKDVDKFTIVAGIPAKLIKKRE
jgi:acetyltransferase-like isoleucine patch superfamily enzyme